MSDSKSVLASKSFWFNFFAACAATLELSGVVDYMSLENQAAAAVVVALVNVVLRYVTVQPIHVWNKTDG